MTRSEAVRNNSNTTNTAVTLRLFFVCLVVTCVVQVVYHHGNIFPSVDCNLLLDSIENTPGVVPKNHSRNTGRNSPSSSSSPSSRDGAIPKFVVDPLFKREQDEIDHGMNDTARCARYGMEPLSPELKQKRRIFFGSMLADENPEVMEAHAIEVYNKYHLVALVESNTTHKPSPRNMTYGPGSHNARKLIESELFGPQTKVALGYWLEDLPGLGGMNRENEQRQTIWKLWLNAGMTNGDVGIMSDFDEVVTRDFLNALQACDFPQFRYVPGKRYPCMRPKIILAAIQFESTPLCIKSNLWHHPDIVPAHCILGIGDPTGRVLPEREITLEQAQKHGYPDPNDKGAKIFGKRAFTWGRYGPMKYPQDVQDNERYPLMDGRDIRGVFASDASVNIRDEFRKKGHVYSTAYHFHNWFTDLEVLRNKYATYGHFYHHARHWPLPLIENDVGMMLRCTQDMGNAWKEEDGTSVAVQRKFHYERGNKLLWDENDTSTKARFSIGGNRPIYFSNGRYVQERHALIKSLVEADVARYGSEHNKTRHKLKEQEEERRQKKEEKERRQKKEEEERRQKKKEEEERRQKKKE